MGGLARKIPVTFVTFAIATAAIAGIPPLAGFFSKDEILWFAFASSRGGSPLLWAVGGGDGAADGVLHVPPAVAHVLRRVAHGRREVEHHVHESPPSMTGVLVVLAVLSAVGGFLAMPHFLRAAAAAARRRAGTASSSRRRSSSSRSRSRSPASPGAAWLFGGDGRARRARCAHASPALHRLLSGKYFIDELYDRLHRRGRCTGFPERVFLRLGDRVILDGSLNGLARSRSDAAGALAPRADRQPAAVRAVRAARDHRRARLELPPWLTRPSSTSSCSCRSPAWRCCVARSRGQDDARARASRSR